jgi:uncharacterized protein YdhG (YjbR/CyaY superfamily)
MHEKMTNNMPILRTKPKTIDEYIASFSPGVRTILQKIRRTIRNVAPGAEEIISYRMPAFKQGRILVYFAAFQNHIGFYPPVSGDAKIEEAISPYAGEKGNLRFQLSQPIPYGLIERIVKLRVKQNLAKAAAARPRGQKTVQLSGGSTTWQNKKKQPTRNRQRRK